MATFKEEQLRFARVRTAFAEKEASAKSLFEAAGVSFPKCEILIRGFKQEKELQVWAKGDESTKYSLIKTYDFCMLSGEIGPKRKQGDYQVPEGFYFIDRFNPASNFYLSLGINYPNASDKKLSSYSNLGGDIFIHGNCVSIGCIPITDALIKEVYVMCVEAKSNGQVKIPVHLYPTKMEGSSWVQMQADYGDDIGYMSLLQSMKPVYDHFEKNKVAPKISVAADGHYSIN